jgi:hypothetical protein
MFFLLRMAFWLAVVCVLIPSGSKPTSPDAQIDAVSAVTLASAAVSDARGFCERQPDACVTGGKVAVALGHKAEAGARTIYDFISKVREKAAEKSASTEKPAGKPASDAGQGTHQGTLTATDLAPAWHAPVPLPPRRDVRNGPSA